MMHATPPSVARLMTAGLLREDAALTEAVTEACVVFVVDEEDALSVCDEDDVTVGFEDAAVVERLSNGEYVGVASADGCDVEVGAEVDVVSYLM